MNRNYTEQLQHPVFKVVAKYATENNIPTYVIGGYVRDLILGRPSKDIDIVVVGDGPAFASEIAKIMRVKKVSIFQTYGTAHFSYKDLDVEFVGARKESYASASRNPTTLAGSLQDDQNRRDFTINAMALNLFGDQFGELIDPFNGISDIENKVLKSPLDPDITFNDDPLRMMRAARFASQLNFEIEDSTLAAMKDMASRISIVSAERIRDEFTKLLMSNNPRRGISIMVDTGLAALVIPEIPKLKLEIDEHHHHKDVYEHSLTVLEKAIGLEQRLGGPNLTLRLAALLHDIGKPKTKQLIPGGGVSFHHHEVVGARMCKERLKKLRFDNHLINDVAKLTFLHLRFHGYGSGEWTDSAVRRYVRDAGELLTHLHLLTRADCTTRNKKKAEGLAKTYDQLEDRIAQLMEQEELDKIRPDLSGDEIMKILDIKPSPAVGKAYEFLLELRLEHGPLGQERAKKELVNWWQKQN